MLIENVTKHGGFKITLEFPSAAVKGLTRVFVLTDVTPNSVAGLLTSFNRDPEQLNLYTREMVLHAVKSGKRRQKITDAVRDRLVEEGWQPPPKPVTDKPPTPVADAPGGDASEDDDLYALLARVTLAEEDDEDEDED